MMSFLKPYEASEQIRTHWQGMVRRVCEVIEASSFETLEALAELIAKTATIEFSTKAITVSIEKPSALHFVDGAGVQITRYKEQHTGY